MKYRPRVPNDSLRHTTSNNLRRACARLASPYPSRPNVRLHLSPLRMHQVIAGYQHRRTLSTATAAFHLISSHTSYQPGMPRTAAMHANGRVNRSPQQNPAQRARTYSQSHRSSVYRNSLPGSTTATGHLSWLFRSNLSGRRGMSLPNEVQKRHFFGLGEIIGVIANVRAIQFISLRALCSAPVACRDTPLSNRVEEDARGCAKRARRGS